MKSSANITIPRSPYEKWIEFVCIGVLTASFVLVVWNHQDLPATIVIHFDWSGNPDGWGSKHTLWLLPALSAIVIYLPLTALSFLQQNDPKSKNESPEWIVRRHRITRLSLALVKLDALFLMLWLIYVVIQSALTNHIRPNPISGVLIFLLILALIIGISIYLEKVNRSTPSA